MEKSTSFITVSSVSEANPDTFYAVDIWVIDRLEKILNPPWQLQDELVHGINKE